MRYFFVEPAALSKPIATIEGSEVRHMKNVLRLKPGDKIRVFDGEGFEYDASIQRFFADRVDRKPSLFVSTTLLLVIILRDILKLNVCFLPVKRLF